MSEILILAVGVLFGGGGLVGVISYIGNKRQNERRRREEAQSAKIAYWREVCASLLTHTRQFRNILLEFQPVRDSRITRFLYVTKTRGKLALKSEQTANAIIACRSKLILNPDTKGIDQAISEFAQTWDAYAEPLDRLLRNIMQKSDTKGFAQLEAAMNTKLEAIEVATQAFVASLETPPTPPSKIKRAIAALLPRLRRITGTVRQKQAAQGKIDARSQPEKGTQP